MKNVRSLLCLVLLVWLGCGDSDPTSPSQKINALPSMFRLEAQASKTEPDGTTLTCGLDFIFELKSETSRTEFRVVYKGTQGGHATRKILAEDGSGFLFNADTYAEIQAELNTYNGVTTILIPINDTSPNRFWSQMSRFEALMNASQHGTGNWICAPLDINEGGYVDEVSTATGTFTITPIS